MEKNLLTDKIKNITEIKRTRGKRSLEYPIIFNTIYNAESLEDLEKKIKELLNNYTLTQVVPVKNCEFNDDANTTKTVNS